MIDPKTLNTNVFPNWCPGCVLPGTIIHTNPDVKPIETLKVGDKVLGSDGRYHRITETMVHRHHGKMYRIKSKCFGETTLTDDHPVLVGKRHNLNIHNKTMELSWERADSISKGDYLAYPIPRGVIEKRELPLTEKYQKDRRSSIMNEKVPITKGFMRLAGYYLSEGYIHKRQAKKNNVDSDVGFTFNIKEKEFVEDIYHIVHELFGNSVTVSTKTREKKNTLDVTINSSRIARSFREWFGSGAANKKIPHFMLLLPLNLQRELLKGMWRGDGWVHKEKLRASYKTISHTLTEQLKLLLLRQEIIPTVLKEEAHENHKASWSIWVLGKRDFPRLQSILEIPARDISQGKTSASIITSEYAMIPVFKIETFDYDGPVYNMEVEDVHSYVSGNAILHNCGDFAIFASIKNVIVKLDMPIENHFFVYGIGCHGHMANFMKAYGFEGLHGRPIPVAEGAKLANKELNVVVVSGDGDTYGEGMSHFMHVMRRNFDITLIVHNNMVYGLTIGQAAPTADCGFKSKSTPEGLIEHPVNPIALAIAQGATFVARGFAGDPNHLANLITEGIKHRGFALIDIFQPCVTFNHINTYQWFREKVYKLEESGHDVTDKTEAMKKAWEKDKLPIGVFYKEEKEKIYEEQTPTQKSIVHEPLETDVTELIGSFK